MRRNPAHTFTVYGAPNDQGGGTPSAAESAQARIEQAAAAGATDPVVADGTVAADGEAPAPPMTYERGKQLEQELKADRERWRPYEDAFGGLSEAARAQALAAAPALGDDLAIVSAAMSGLTPADRQYVASVLNLSRTDPVAAAQEFERIAQTLRGDGAEAAEPDPAAQEYVTREEQEQRFAEERAQRQIDTDQAAIAREITDLGYDLYSEEPIEQARVQQLLSLAGAFAGDLAKANELIGLHRQAVIDEYVAAKSADADRPTAPTAGASPSTERQLHTLEDAAAAATNRLAGAGFAGLPQPQ